MNGAFGCTSVYSRNDGRTEWTFHGYETALMAKMTEVDVPASARGESRYNKVPWPLEGFSFMGDKIIADSTEFSQKQLVVGRNRLGQWIVADFRRSEGRIFNNRQDALNFAMFPCGAQPRAVLFIPDVLDVPCERWTICK